MKSVISIYLARKFAPSMQQTNEGHIGYAEVDADKCGTWSERQIAKSTNAITRRWVALMEGAANTTQGVVDGVDDAASAMPTASSFDSWARSLGTIAVRGKGPDGPITVKVLLPAGAFKQMRFTTALGYTSSTVQPRALPLAALQPERPEARPTRKAGKYMGEAAHPAFDAFAETVATLRSPQGGCPWNRAQTHASIGDCMIEEAYEALDAIQAGDVGHLREELGDVLLQVVLQSQIAADAGEFTIDDVCAGINAKMIRRHPHVFGDADADNANEVADLWEQVKLAEKQAAGAESRKSLLDSVPAHFPALLQTQKISRKAAAAGFEWPTVADAWDKVAEERAELEAAYAAAPKTPDGKVLAPDPATEGATERDPLVADVEMEFGDLLFALVNVARKMGVDAEAALRASNAKFRRRWTQIEQAAWQQGREVEDLSQPEMEDLWQQAKLQERKDCSW